MYSLLPLGLGFLYYKTFSVIPLCSEVLWGLELLSQCLYSQPTLRNKVRDDTHKFVSKPTGVGSLSQKTQGFGKAYTSDTTTLSGFSDAHLSSKSSEPSEDSVLPPLPEPAASLLIVRCQLILREEWEGKRQKKTNQNSGLSYCLEKHYHYYLHFFFLNHRGCPCTRDIQRPKLFRKRKESNALCPKPTPCAVFVVERGTRARRCPLFT